MSSHPEERRNYQRISVDCKIHFAIGPEVDVRKRYYHTSSVRDLSAKGVSFNSAKTLPVGTFLHIKMDFPKGPTLKVRGEVLRCVDSGPGLYTIGVKFYGSAQSLSELFKPWI